MNRSTLLSQLQIDREPERTQREPRRGPPWWTILGGVAAALLVAGLAWFLVARPDRPAIRVAVAAAASPGASAHGGSLLDASGYVVARRAATVSSKVTGKVAEVLIEEGQRVAAGQVIARLDGTNAQAALAQAEAQVAAADASLRVAQIAVDQAGPRDSRSQRLHADGYLSDQAVEDTRNALDNARSNLDLVRRQAQVARATAEIARRNLDDTVVRAPFAGVVTVKAAQPGEMVSPISAGGGFTRTGIGTIVDMDSLGIQVDVNESFINRVAPGQPVEAVLNAYPDWRIPGEVIAIIPSADRNKATVKVRVALRQKDRRILPDMGVRVSFLSAPSAPGAPPAGRAGVLVPAAAVRVEGKAGVVFVFADDKVQRRSVTLGQSVGADRQVLSGLSAGERVVLSPPASLVDGAAVKAAPGS